MATGFFFFTSYIQFSGIRVLVLLAIYTDSSSVLSMNTLTNLGTHILEWINRILFI